RDTDVDLIRELPVEAHILDLRNCPECGLHLRKIDGEDIDTFAQTGCCQGFLAREDSVEIEGYSPQGVFGIVKEKSVERRLKAEIGRRTDCGSKEHIGHPTGNRLSPPPPGGRGAHAHVEQMSA